MAALSNVILPEGGILVASPNSSLRGRLFQNFECTARPAEQATGGGDALCKLESGVWQVLVLDRRLPDPVLDKAVALMPALQELLRQDPGESATLY